MALLLVREISSVKTKKFLELAHRVPCMRNKCCCALAAGIKCELVVSKCLLFSIVANVFHMHAIDLGIWSFGVI